MGQQTPGTMKNHGETWTGNGAELRAGRGAWLRASLGLLAALAFATPLTQAAVTEAWVRRYNGPANSDDRIQAVAVDVSGNVVVTGYSYNGTNYDYYTAKYAAATSVLLWEKRYNGPGNRDDRASAVAVDKSANIVVTGSSAKPPSDDKDFYTAKYAAADGALLWEQRYDGPVHGDDFAAAVAIDASDNVVVSGYSYGSGGSKDYYTAKYAAADGSLLWEKHYDGPTGGDDFAAAVAMDGSGNVVVTGSSAGNGSGADYYTVKYAAANGTNLWQKRYNSPANYQDNAEAVVLDSSGNVVVTGWSYTNAFYPDYFTAKYAAADGALLWQQRYNGPLNGDDKARAVAVDGIDNVVVTGYSQGGGGDYNYYTAKFASTNGALLWEKRNMSFGQAQAVAVDGSGNVVVTGNYFNGLNEHCYTAKYAAADGALLWEKLYNGLADEDDVVTGSHSLALGPNGMVAIAGYSSGNSGVDYLTIVYRETLPAISIEKVLTDIRLRFPGVANHSYQVLRASSLTGPWSTNATLTAVTNGPLEYLDTNAPPGSAFYRTSTGP